MKSEVSENILKKMPIGYALHQFVKNEKGHPCDYLFLDINSQFEKQTGLYAKDIVGKKVTEVLPEIIEDDFDWIKTYIEVAYEGQNIEIEQYFSSIKQWFRVQAFSPAEGYFVTLMENITKEKEELFKLRSLFEHNAAKMLFIEPQTGAILDANPAAIDFYGYTKEKFLTLSIQDINVLDKEKVEDLMQRTSMKEQEFYIFSHKLKNGEERMVEVCSSPTYYNGKKALISIIFDVTEKEKAIDKVKHLAYHDNLTNVYNRKYFEELFSKLNKKENYPLAIIMGDINGLKMVNDTYGHKVGDELIKAVVKEFKNCLKDYEYLARIDGGEFVVLLTNENEEYVSNLTNKLHESLEKRINIFYNKNIEVYASVSFGHSMQSEEHKDLDSIIKIAEEKMNRQKFYNNKSIKSNMINSMMSTLYQKSEREKRHSERVGDYSAKIAQALNWDVHRVQRIKVAGALHDIGKIVISEKILNKIGKLEEEEWIEMRLHTIKSARILKEIYEYEDISEIVLTHHERWDGKGYPKGLKGKEIPIEARIIALADSFDAMTSNRSYRKALSKEKTIKEIRENIGKQFDPDIVEIAIENVFEKI